LTNAADINLDDIDNVSVLSGPAHQRSWLQGASGAIIITTKKAGRGGSGSIGLK